MSSKRRGKYLIPWAKKAPNWGAHDLLDRTAACVNWLVVHEFMTDGEATKIRGRIKEWVADANEADAL